MLTVTQPLLSTESYLLYACIAFIAYVLLYLSVVGSRTGRRGNLRARPRLAGYDSLRTSNSRISPEDRKQIDALRAAEGTPDTPIPFFNPTETLPCTDQTASRREEVSETAVAKESLPRLPEEEDDFLWPGPGAYGGTEEAEEEGSEQAMPLGVQRKGCPS